MRGLLAGCGRLGRHSLKTAAIFVAMSLFGGGIGGAHHFTAPPQTTVFVEPGSTYPLTQLINFDQPGFVQMNVELGVDVVNSPTSSFHINGLGTGTEIMGHSYRIYLFKNATDIARYKNAGLVGDVSITFKAGSTSYLLPTMSYMGDVSHNAWLDLTYQFKTPELSLLSVRADPLGPSSLVVTDGYIDRRDRKGYLVKTTTGTATYQIQTPNWVTVVGATTRTASTSETSVVVVPSALSETLPVGPYSGFIKFINTTVPGDTFSMPIVLRTEGCPKVEDEFDDA
ncbi:MAG TPA: hypothetical protein VFO36_14035, partial [Nitrospiraceae bacterium]|nr:hypothetical protein [Nitrospiraceae bacterium]